LHESENEILDLDRDFNATLNEKEKSPHRKKKGKKEVRDTNEIKDLLMNNN
jgi:hypothetical protein